MILTVTTWVAVIHGLPDPSSAPTIKQALLIENQTQSTPVTLPYRQSNQPINQRVRFKINLEQTPPFPPDSVLYVPSVLAFERLWIDEQEVTDQVKDLPLRSEVSRPLIVPLGSFLNPKTLTIELSTSTVIGSYISPIWIGSLQLLELQHKTRVALLVGYRQILTWWLALLAVAMFLLWIQRRQEMAHLYFVVILLWQFFNELPVALVHQLALPQWWSRVGYLSDVWQAVFLVPFIYRFTNVKSPLTEWFFLGVALLGTVACMGVEASDFTTIEKWLLLPIAVIHLLWGFVVLSRSALSTNAASQLVWLSLVMAICFALHDIMIIAGLLNSRVDYLLTYAFLPALSTIGFLLIARFVKAQHALDNMLETLQLKLSEKEAQLRDAFAKEKLAEQRQLMQSERQRILADMHDGLGGQLMSILASSRKRKPDLKIIEASAQQALIDLRLMVLSLDSDHHDLQTLLAGFREQAQRQCDSQNVELIWQNKEIPQVESLAPVFVANFLRIAQEALANALKHSNSHAISIDISGDLAGGIVLQVKDWGDGKFNKNTSGRGLHTLNKRTKTLNATLKIEPSPNGTVVCVAIPKNTLGF